MRLVGDVHGEVVALLRRRRLFDRVVVVDDLGVPLVRLGAEEAVEALEPATARPVASGRRDVHLVVGAEMPLADDVGVPAELAEDLGEHPVRGRDRAARVREADRGLGDARHAVARVVPAGQQARSRRGAERGRVPLGVPHAIRRRPGRCLACRSGRRSRHRGEADVVEHDVDDVRGAFGSLRRFERCPVRFGIADVYVHDSVELRGHDVSGLFRHPSKGSRGVARPSGHLRGSAPSREVASDATRRAVRPATG